MRTGDQDRGWGLLRFRRLGLALGLVIALIASLAIVPSAFAYYVENASFEEHGASDMLPALWPYEWRDYCGLWVPTASWGGYDQRQCVTTALPAKIAGRPYAPYNGFRQDVAITAGQPIRLMVGARSDTPAATAIYMEWLTSKGGTPLGSVRAVGTDFGVNGSGWVQMRLTGTAPPNANAVRVWLRVEGGDESIPRLVYYDLVEVVPPDTTAPVTTASGYPGGWVQWPIDLALSASDDSGLKPKTYYRIGSGATQTYASPVHFAYVQGETTVSYWSVDHQGNVESTKQITLRFGVAPVATSSITIKTAATTTYIGRTVTLSGAVTPIGMIGKNIVVYVKKPGRAYYSYSSNRTVYSLAGNAAWLYKYYFKPGMVRGYYYYKAVVPAGSGYPTSTSPTTVSIRVR